MITGIAIGIPIGAAAVHVARWLARKRLNDPRTRATIHARVEDVGRLL